MTRTILGLLFLLAVAGASAIVAFVDIPGLTRERRDPVEVSIYFGGEKTAFLANPRVQAILEDRYAINLTATRAGSIEMVTSLPLEGRDCVWPSNAIAVELAHASGVSVLGDDLIFNSPIVMFAWAEVADALQSSGVVRADNSGHLFADLAALSLLIEDETRWREDLGVNVYGRFRVLSTDPTRSNSGNIWSALLATAFNGGEVPTSDEIESLLPQIERYFAGGGYMEASSGDIFENFLNQGIGARPIIVGYENQLVEFLFANETYTDLIRDRIRTIYPEPTIFASHPLISLSPNCGRLAEALLDPEVQSIAWSDHGFRTGLVGVENDASLIEIASIPETISLVAPMPSAEVMGQIIERLE